MGFTGAITTDDITMGGIVEKYEVAEACVQALNAGNDLVLIRDESSLIDEVYPALVDAARPGGSRGNGSRTPFAAPSR